VKIAPAAKPVTPQASQTNRFGQPQNGQPAQVAPNAFEPASRPADRSMERPVNPNSPSQRRKLIGLLLLSQSTRTRFRVRHAP